MKLTKSKKVYLHRFRTNVWIPNFLQILQWTLISVQPSTSVSGSSAAAVFVFELYLYFIWIVFDLYSICIWFVFVSYLYLICIWFVFDLLTLIRVQSSTSVIGSSSESAAVGSNPNTSRLVIFAACNLMLMLHFPWKRVLRTRTCIWGVIGTLPSKPPASAWWM